MNKPVRLQVQAPNLAEAREFLQLITGEDDPPVTFQVFDDKAKRFDIAEWRHGRLSDPTIRAWLIAKAAEGCGIFFTLNECDGHGRKRENVTAARVLGVDFDGAPLPQEQPIPFDIINESSEGRYHGYYLIQRTTDLVKWSEAQAQLAAYYGGDAKVFDPPRVFRLPGFYHQKGPPFRTRTIRKCSMDEARFDRHAISDIKAVHPCDYKKPAARVVANGGDAEGEFYDNERDITHLKGVMAKTTPAPGERNNVAYRLACLCDDHGICPETATELLLEWNDKNDVGLPESEIHHVIHNASRYKNSPAGVKASFDAKEDFADTPIDPDTDIGDDEDITEKELASEEPSDFTGDRVQHMTVKDQEWIVEDLIPADDVIGYYGDGGSGKTYTMLQLVVAKTAGKEWLGKPTGNSAKTMVFSCEEYTDKIVPRLHKIMESITSPYNQEGENRIEWDDIKGLKVKVMAGHDSILARLDKNTGKIRATKLFKWVEKEIRAWGPKLVVFDALYDIFGENQNDLPSARQFVRLLRRLGKKLKIAIIVTAHPSQTGMQTGTGTSGTVGWRNAFRGFLYIHVEHPKSGTGVKVHHIESRKQNYGAPDVLIDAVWNEGLFTPVYTDKAEREKECKRKFMELLRAYLKDGRSVTHTATATNAAPKVFAADREKAAGFSKAEFKDAMNSLFNAGRIKVVGYRKANRTYGERLEPIS